MVTLLALLGCTIVLVDVPCSVPPGIPPVDDTAATDCTERYPDADGDGYGDEDGATVICDAAGFSDTPGDCDDADPDVHPDALERCDGVSDACDPTWTSDDGIVTWTTADGFQDATADFAAGSDGDPAALTYDEGRVDVCAGTWFVNLTLDGARIVGTGDVVLDGGGAGPVVLVTSGENLLQGLTLTNGAGSEGGGLDTTGGSAQVDTCVITGNTAANGGEIGRAHV